MIESRLHGALVIAARAVAGESEQQHLTSARARANAFGHLIPVETWKADVDDCHLRIRGLQYLEAPVAVFRLVHTVTRQLKHHGKELARVSVVLDEKDAPGSHPFGR